MAASQKRRRIRTEGRNSFDFVLLAVVFFLVGFGLLMIYSVSSYEAAIDYNDSGYYLKKQMVSTLVGVFGLIATMLFPYRNYKKFAGLAYMAAIVSILLLLTPLGVNRNGATRWINLGIITVQSAEIVKIGIIIFQASYITRLGKSIRTLKGVVAFFIPPTIVAGMIYVISKNLSSAIIVMGIAVCMLFVAVPDYKTFVGIAVAVIALAAVVIMYASGADATGTYRLARVQAWLDPESYSTDKAFQTLQALYAIGSGGFWGKGLGQSMQKRGFLPEAQNDMIFSIICEELGLFGAMVIIILFVVLIWSCMMIANSAVDQFGSMLVVGVMSHFAIQVILNIAVVTNTIPNTGITLPFISYGGSATLFLLSEIGIVLNVSKYSKM